MNKNMSKKYTKKNKKKNTKKNKKGNKTKATKKNTIKVKNGGVSHVRSARKTYIPPTAHTAHTARTPKRAGVVAPTKSHSYFLDKALQIYSPKRTIESEIEFNEELNSFYKDNIRTNYNKHFELLRLIVYKVYTNKVDYNDYEALKLFMMRLDELYISLEYTTETVVRLDEKSNFYNVLVNIKECYVEKGIESIPFYNNDTITLSNTELYKYLNLLTNGHFCYTI